MRLRSLVTRDSAKNSLRFLVIGGLALAPFVVEAQTVPLTQDSYVVTSPATGTNYGSAVTLNVVGSSGAQALVQFDLTTLPAGTTAANISKATLALFVNKMVTAGTVNISTANGSWTELGVNGTNTPVPLASVATGLSISAASDYIYVDATAAVQAWLNGTQNNGFIIAPNDTLISVAFDSKESTTTSHPATLSILLSSNGAAGPTGATGVGLVGATGATGVGATGATGVGVAGATGASGPRALVYPDQQAQRASASPESPAQLARARREHRAWPDPPAEQAWPERPAHPVWERPAHLA